MIGKIRLAVALACVVVSTLVLVPLQLIAMKTKLWSEWRVLRLWHRANCRALGFRIHQHQRRDDNAGERDRKPDLADHICSATPFQELCANEDRGA